MTIRAVMRIAGHIASHDKLLIEVDLVLAPKPGALSRFVNTVCSFGDDSFQHGLKSNA
jgi:hypothetical protein